MDFFDRLKEGIDKSVKTVSVKSTEMMDATKVKSQISSFREQKRTVLEELGKIAYDLFCRAETVEPKIKEKCEQIGALDRRIAEKEKELESIHRQAQEALSQPPPPTVVATCQCGALIREGAKFCAACGKPVEPPPAG